MCYGLIKFGFINTTEPQSTTIMVSYNKTICSLILVAFLSISATVRMYFNYDDNSFTVGQKKRIHIVYGYNGYCGPIDDPKVSSQLVALSEFLKTHPNIEIEISSHTDFRGGNAYNEKLSELRAKAACKKLIVRYSTDTTQLTYKGYGENIPTIIDDRIFTNLSPEQKEMFPVGTILNEETIKKMPKNQVEHAHRLNRRTLLTITSTGN